MRKRELRALVVEAERLRVAYLDALNRRDLEAGLRIGAEELVPVAERLTEQNVMHLDSLAVTLRNLAGICRLLQRPISGIYYQQRALHAAMEVEARRLPLHDSLADVSTGTANLAQQISHGAVPGPADLSPVERDQIGPAVALVPWSIVLMGQLDSFPWACQLRVAVTTLRTITDRGDVDVVDHESRSMVWLARLAYERGDAGFAAAEIGEALKVWIAQLDYGKRFWSTQLGETWTVAADLLDAMGCRQSAASLRQAIAQAMVARPQFRSLAEVAALLDLRVHYRAALAGLTPPAG